MPAEFPCIDEKAESRSINDGILYAILISTLISLSIREYSSLRCRDSPQNVTWRTRNTIRYSPTRYFTLAISTFECLCHTHLKMKSQFLSSIERKLHSRTRIKMRLGQFSSPQIAIRCACAYCGYLWERNCFPFGFLHVSFNSPRGPERTNAITSIINLDSRSRHVIVNAIIRGATGKSWNNGRAKDA